MRVLLSLGTHRRHPYILWLLHWYCVLYHIQTNPKFEYILITQHIMRPFLCFVVISYKPVSPYPRGLFRWHLNYYNTPVPSILENINTEFIIHNDPHRAMVTNQSKTKPCANLWDMMYMQCKQVIRHTLRESAIKAISCMLSVHGVQCTSHA